MKSDPTGVGTDLMDRKGFRITLFVVIPLVVFLLVSAAIRVSQYGIDHTVMVLGQKEWVAGWPGAVRITLLSDGGDYFLPTRISGTLERNQDRHPLFDGPGSQTGHCQARNFTVPNWAPGPARLILDIEFDERRRTVTADVMIVRTPGPENLIVPADVQDKPLPNPVAKGEATIRVFTEDRGAPTGLTSMVFLRSQDKEGAAKSLSFDILPPDRGTDIKAPKTVATDALGLLALSANPMELSWPIRVEGGTQLVSGAPVEQANPGPPPPAYLHPKVVYSGLAAALHPPLPATGDPLKVTAHQLSGSGPLYVDLFKDGVWVQGVSGWFQGGSATVQFVPTFTGLGRAQITTSAFGSGKTIAVRHLYITEENESQVDGLKSVLGTLEQNERDEKWAKSVLALPLEGGTAFDRRLAVAFSLSRLYKGHRPIPTLIHSRHTDDSELSAYKARFQRMVMVAILLIGLGIASLIVLLALRAHQTQQRVTAMILSEDLDLESMEHNTKDASAAKYRAVLQGAVLFLIIMGAFISVAILVDTLTWQR